MKITTITYTGGREYLRNLGNYENVKTVEHIAVTAEIDPDLETPDGALMTLRNWVVANLESVVQDQPAPEVQEPQSAPAPSNPPPTDEVPDPNRATDKQVKALYAIARARRGMDETAANAFVLAEIGVRVSGLTKREASTAIDLLQDDSKWGTR